MEEEIKANVVYLFIVGSLSVIILVLGVVSLLILFQKRMLKNLREKQDLEEVHQKSLLKSFIETQEKERKRIAADLHDEISASLAAAKMLLGQKEINHQSAKEIKEIIEKTANRARDISHNLMPPSIETLGIFKVLESFFNKIQSEKLEIKFDFDKSIQFSDKEQLALYRITHELINNTLKYAEANIIIVSISIVKDSIVFNYSDNGKGFNHKITNGMGLKNIESRAQSIHGTINFYSIPESSTGVSITMTKDE